MQLPAFRPRALAAAFSVSAAFLATPALAQDFGLMVRIAQAQPGAAVVLARLHLQRPSPPVAQPLPLATQRPVVSAVAQPALALTAAAAAMPRPALLLVAAR